MLIDEFKAYCRIVYHYGDVFKTFLCTTNCIYARVLGLTTCSSSPKQSSVFRHLF